MNNKIVSNILINTGLAAGIVLLQNWALQNSFEETFIFLAIMYGIVVIIVNAFLTMLNQRK